VYLNLLPITTSLTHTVTAIVTSTVGLTHTVDAVIHRQALQPIKGVTQTPYKRTWRSQTHSPYKQS
jgi:hypothetical protein